MSGLFLSVSKCFSDAAFARVVFLICSARATGRNPRGFVEGDAGGVMEKHVLSVVIASAAKQPRVSPQKDSGLLHSARNDGVWRCGILRSRCPDALHRAAVLRRAGTQQATRITVAWAPALQRTTEEVLRRVRGTRLSLKGWHRFPFSRRIPPELCVGCCPSKVPRAQGRPGTGWHPRSTVRKLRYEICTAAYR